MRPSTTISCGILAVLLLGAGPSVAREVSVRHTVDTADLSLHTSISGSSRATIGEGGRGGLPGQPALPYRVIRLAVPPDAVESSVSVKVTPLNQVTVGAGFEITPAPPMRPLNRGPAHWGPHSARIVDGRDTAVYGRPELFPASWADTSPDLSGLRRYRFVSVTLHPLRFRPTDGALFHARRFDVEVSFERAPVEGSISANCGGDQLAAKLLDNYHEARAWYPPSCFGGEDGSMGVAIITTEELRWGSHELLAEYIELRNDQGYEVEVYTEDDWDKSTGKKLDDRADRIRRWLKDNYEKLDLGYAFLIGNPDPAGGFVNSIPMKICGRYADSMMGEIEAPTDFYYADLTGTWDSSGNGVLCEFGSDKVDFTPEIYVGRFPVYSDGAEAVDEMLARVIAYERESEDGDISWRRRMMLPNSIYFYERQEGSNGTRWDGAATGEWFVRDELAPRGMDWTTLYEREGIAPSNFESHFGVEDTTVIDQWVRGYGIVFWMGHGSNSGVYRTIWVADGNPDEGIEPDGIVDYEEMSSPEFMATRRSHMLVDAPPPFVIHGSCSNGTPEDAENLGYSMLRRGAIATLSASRVALAWHVPEYETEHWEKLDEWDGCVVDLVADYTVNILDGKVAGQSLGETIASTSDISEDAGWYQKSIQNLYGDPLVKLVMCREDADCDNGTQCDGTEICEGGSCLPGEAIVCDEIGGCEAECVEGAGCQPMGDCEPEVDAGSDGDPDAGADLDTDEDAGAEEEPIDPSALSAATGCSFAPSSTSSLGALLGLI